MSRWINATTCVLMFACNPQEPTFSGYPMADFFPFDGEVIGWTFGSRDANIDYVLDRVFDPTLSETVDGVRIHTFSTSRRCLPDVENCGAGPVWEYELASGPLGISLHAYQLEGEDRVELDPPVRIVNTRMSPGQSASTLASDGHDWIAKFERFTDCDQAFEVAWDCAHIVLETDPPGHWLAGDWYAVPGYNVVSFKRTGDSARWRLVALPERP